MRQNEYFTKWVLAQALNLDKFQSVVCWFIGISALLATIPPIILVTIEGTKSQWGCQGVQFTILAHYRIHEWLTDMFTEFKSEVSVLHNVTHGICYRLVIAPDSQFDSTYSPIVWIPENDYWIDYAETFDEEHSSKGKLISDRNTYCSNLTNIPLGIVTWSKYAAILNQTNYFNISQIVNIASRGWKNYSKDASFSNFSFQHGHPKVTSGGLFGVAVVFQNAIGQVSNGDKLSSLTSSQISTGKESLALLEENVYGLGPNEIELIDTLLAHGPNYVQSIFGFENDVAYSNLKYNSTLMALWDDILSFVYLQSSYWMTHPVCVLDMAPGNSSSNLLLAELFKTFITVSSRKNKLLNYGIRPYGYNQTELESSKILSEGHGVNATVSPNNTAVYLYPTPSTGKDLYGYFQDVKRPVYLEILLDVSKTMSKTYTNSKIRWYYVNSNIDYFSKNLEGGAIVNISCFAKGILTCAYGHSLPSGNLSSTRNASTTYFKDDLTWVSEEQIYVFTALTETITRIRKIKAANEQDGIYYNYAILVISEEDSKGSEDEANALLDTVDVNFSPNDVRIFPVLYFGRTSSYTYSIFKKVAIRTNGEYYTAKSDINDVFESISYFF